MSKQTVLLRVEIEDTWDAGDRLQVYTDQGSGTIDLNKPLLKRPLEIFPGQQAGQPYGRQPYAVGRHGDNLASRPPNGIAGTIYGTTPHGGALVAIEVAVEVAPAFGKWKFAAQVMDGHGNVQTAALQELSAMVSGTDPAPPAEFALVSYDAPSDRVTFSFSKDAE